MTVVRKRVLCVGTDAAGDPGLAARIATLSLEWEAVFCDTGAGAAELCRRAPCDALVVNETLPDQDGFHFLHAMQQAHPNMIRMIVADLAGADAAIKCAGGAHHCLPQPWDERSLATALDRAFGLDIWLSNPTVRGLVDRMKHMPSPPDLYFEVVKALQSPEVDLHGIVEKASRDPAITAKLLRLANSAAFGLAMKVTGVEEAIGYLGLETTRSLILLAHTFACSEQVRVPGFDMDSLWSHSVNVGAMAKRIAQVEGAPATLVDECFLSGLLHDIGKLLLAVNMPGEFGAAVAMARQERIPLWEAEQARFGATHSEVGAELLARWNLPLSVVESLALHHYPSKLISAGFGPLAAVHAANAFEQGGRAGAVAMPATPLDSVYFTDNGLIGHIDLWREVCLEEAASAAA